MAREKRDPGDIQVQGSRSLDPLDQLVALAAEIAHAAGLLDEDLMDLPRSQARGSGDDSATS